MWKERKPACSCETTMFGDVPTSVIRPPSSDPRNVVPLRSQPPTKTGRRASAMSGVRIGLGRVRSVRHDFHHRPPRRARVGRDLGPRLRLRGARLRVVGAPGSGRQPRELRVARGGRPRGGAEARSRRADGALQARDPALLPAARHRHDRGARLARGIRRAPRAHAGAARRAPRPPAPRSGPGARSSTCRAASRSRSRSRSSG